MPKPAPIIQATIKRRRPSAHGSSAPPTPQWSRELVAARLREAWDTLRRMPAHVLPEKITCAWPEVVRDWQEAYGYTAERVRLARPSPGAIDRAMESIGWFAFIALEPPRKHETADAHARLTRARSRAVWLCTACGLGPKRAADIIGYHRDTVRTLRDGGLEVILRRLRSR